MRHVAQHLESYAQSATEDEIINIFGRSAFNRYYYACFLATREMLGEFDPGWRNTPHKEIPNLLETTVQKRGVAALERIKKLNKRSPQYSSYRTELTHATNELAELLRLAYDARIISDYEPEERIIKNGSTISLRHNKLNSANNWVDRTYSHIKIIRKIWREAGLV